MARQALPPGTTQRRIFFGLIDADGWPAAFWQALFWFLLIIFMLGYLPDRAYYFTVEPAITLGVNVISPINLCDGSNGPLPCPPPRGAVIPWQPSPANLALPAPRSQAGTFQSGTLLYVAGGLIDGKATDSVVVTTTTSDGNFSAWQAAPSLPAPRTDFAVTSFNGTPFIIGGLDASGQPTNTVIQGLFQAGSLTGWKVNDALALPVAMSGASAVATGTGMWLIGGRTASGPVNTVYRSLLDNTVKPAALHPFVVQPTLAVRDGNGDPAPRFHAIALTTGSQIFLIGGEGAQGVTNQVYLLTLDAVGEPSVNGQGQVIGWGQSVGATALPSPRTQASGFVANGALYVPGGFGPDGQPTATFYWTVPDATTGAIAQWNLLDETNLPQPLAASSSAVAGSFALLIGGQGPTGAQAGSYRANLAPAAPFFQLGILGATIPGLSVKGGVGAQLGYVMAGIVGGTNFILLIAFAVLYSRPESSKRLLERLTRGRYRAPPRDEYFPD
ncbi:MAG: hypothetical protein ACHQZR_01870 [Candidatus Limnocylindrales bacterium]